MPKHLKTVNAEIFHSKLCVYIYAYLYKSDGWMDGRVGVGAACCFSVYCLTSVTQIIFSVRQEKKSRFGISVIKVFSDA